MRWTISIRADSNYDDMISWLRRVSREANFEQVVLEGINAIQRFQRQEAPVGKEGTIPRSIKPARVIRERFGGWSATSRTTSDRGWYTNEGTWSGRRSEYPRPPKERYQITQERRYRSGPREGQPYILNIDHPGIKAQKWFDKGFEQGVPVAESAFRRKVGRMLRGRG